MLKIGQTYSQYSSFQERMWHRLADLSKAYFDNDSPYTKLIDLGCGNGARTLSCFEHFPSLHSITAIDSNPDMIREAREKNSHPDISYHHFDINCLEQFESEQFVSGQFDVLTSNWVLHWIKDKNTLFENIDQFSRSGSVMLLSSCERIPSILGDMDQVIRDYLKLDHPKPDHLKPGHLKPSRELPLYYLNAQEWCSMAESYGWSKCEVVTDIEHRCVKSDGSYIKEWYAASAGKAFYDVPFEQFDVSFIKELTQYIHARYADVKGQNWVFTEESALMVFKKQ
ncbi:MAG: class I SAM-dependent methyltransferase [Kangiellaceae bacterium]|nr:class I SAM-dependent methyltransferase [Kangiellaceae bacterium]MCW9000552.1 class I SAM-dependent methyltransferase [Kangiellaceae bacterium]MCW9018015.1 class I SAM-dependent methyltransferase [Kangiellaceae bacterium]